MCFPPRAASTFLQKTVPKQTKNRPRVGQTGLDRTGSGQSRARSDFWRVHVPKSYVLPSQTHVPKVGMPSHTWWFWTDFGYGNLILHRIFAKVILRKCASHRGRGAHFQNKCETNERKHANRHREGVCGSKNRKKTVSGVRNAHSLCGYPGSRG